MNLSMKMVNEPHNNEVVIKGEVDGKVFSTQLVGDNLFDLLNNALDDIEKQLTKQFEEEEEAEDEETLEDYICDLEDENDRLKELVRKLCDQNASLKKQVYYKTTMLN